MSIIRVFWREGWAIAENQHNRVRSSLLNLADVIYVLKKTTFNESLNAFTSLAVRRVCHNYAFFFEKSKSR